MTKKSESDTETHLHALTGPYGNPYLGMRTQRAKEMLTAVIPRSARYLDPAIIQDAATRLWRTEKLQTRFYRDACVLAARGLRDALPPSWKRELVDFECLRWEVGYASAEDVSNGEIAFDWHMHLRTHPTLRRVQYDHAVHEEFEEKPERTPTFLCLHRRADDSIETRWMGAFEYEFLDQLDPTRPALHSLRIGVEKRNPEERETYIYRVAEIVGKMLESKALYTREA